MVASLALRTPLKVDVVRDRGTLSRIVAGGQIENIYRVQIGNATEQDQRYVLSASGIEGLRVASETEVDVGAAQDRWVVVRLQAPYGAAGPGSHGVEITATAVGDPALSSRRTARSWCRAEGPVGWIDSRVQRSCCARCLVRCSAGWHRF